MRYCKSTKYYENLMLTNKKKCYIKTIVHKRDLRMRKLYRPYLPREAAARGFGSVATQAVKENSD